MGVGAAGSRSQPPGARAGEAGYAMAALLVGLSVMAVVMTMAMPVWSTAAKRAREDELVFRGEQYARAIGLYQRKYANALPPSIDVLLNERFLRRKYLDPITGGEFQALTGAAGQATPGVGGAGPGGAQPGSAGAARGGVQPGTAGAAQSGGFAGRGLPAGWYRSGPPGWGTGRGAGRGRVRRQRRHRRRREQEHGEIAPPVQRARRIQRVDLCRRAAPDAGRRRSGRCAGSRPGAGWPRRRSRHRTRRPDPA